MAFGLGVGVAVGFGVGVADGGVEAVGIGVGDWPGFGVGVAVGAVVGVLVVPGGGVGVVICWLCVLVSVLAAKYMIPPARNIMPMRKAVLAAFAPFLVSFLKVSFILKAK